MTSAPDDSGSDSFSDLVRTLRSAGCVFAEDEARLLLSDNPSAEVLSAMVERRVAGEPLEHVLGWAEFCGARFVVQPGVFVPRRRTEFLVAQAIALGRSTLNSTALRPPGRVESGGAALVVVDLCCGVGAIGAALAAAIPGCELHAADVDPAAVDCARRNVAAAGGLVHQGDLYAALPPNLRGRVNLLLVNAPYVPTDEIRLMPTEARQHEGRVALDGGSDGLDIQRRVVADAPQWLAPGGYLLIETSERQAPDTAAAFARSGLNPEIARSEDWDATVVIGRRD